MKELIKHWTSALTLIKDHATSSPLHMNAVLQMLQSQQVMTNQIISKISKFQPILQEKEMLLSKS